MLITERELEEIVEEGGERFYYVKGMGRLPSVTTIIHRGFPAGPGLLKWFKKCTEEEINIKRDKALSKGTELHGIFERYARAGFDKKVLTKDEKEKIRGAITWAETVKPKVEHVEAIVAYQGVDAEFAGRVDLVCTIGKEKWLVDLKTGQSAYDDYPCQIGSYARALGLNKGGVLLLTDTKKGYRFYEVNLEVGWEGFKHAYGIYKYLSEKRFYEKRS